MTVRAVRVVVIAAALVVATGALPARAAWTSGGPGNAFGKALTMPGGTTPSVALSGRNATVTWSQVQLADGTPVTNYLVRRYNASGVSQSVLSDCNGTLSATSCTEKAVPPGSWRYAVVPVRANWRGPESPRSSEITVSAPKLTFTSPTTVTSLPSTLSGTVSNFATGQTLSFRLDNASTGTLLSGTSTPSVIPTDGSASVSVTIPAGTSQGPHTVYAIGSAGDVASAAMTVDSAPRPTDLVIATVSGGTAGLAQRGDTVTVTFSKKLAVASLCSTWSGNDSNQSITANNVVQVTIKDNAAGGNDQLIVATTSAACGGAFRFGSINLGSSNFVTGGDAIFSGGTTNASRISWDAATFRLQVTLGAKSGGLGAVGVVPTAVPATYMPDAAITDTTGTGMTGTASRSAVQF